MGVDGSAKVPAGSLELITANREPHSRYATSAERNSGSAASPTSSAVSSSEVTHRRLCSSDMFLPKWCCRMVACPPAGCRVVRLASHHLADEVREVPRVIRRHVAK